MNLRIHDNVDEHRHLEGSDDAVEHDGGCGWEGSKPDKAVYRRVVGRIEPREALSRGKDSPHPGNRAGGAMASVVGLLYLPSGIHGIAGWVF